MTQKEMFEKLWWSEQQEFLNRQGACDGCKGQFCKSPFLGMALELLYNKEFQRTKIINVPCRYTSRIHEKAKNGIEVHQYDGHFNRPDLSSGKV